MTEHRETVRLVLDDTFTRRAMLAHEAVRTMLRRAALDQATWEPHDWAEWP